MKELRIAVVGGGAAGIFAAIRAGELAKENKIPVYICVFESSSRFLSKVLISGGGRCNVTFNNFEPRSFCKNYPRGNQELISPMFQFQAQNTVNWFESRGVKLKTEEDGRIFPTTDQSDTIVECLLDEAEKYRVQLYPRSSVEKIKVENEKFIVSFTKGKDFPCDKVFIATGSSPTGYKLAKMLGHSIEELVPSLFSFNIQHPILKTLEGMSFPEAHVELSVEGKKFEQQAPVLITHWGLSGPGILKLSAWAAREMQKSKYKAKLFVNWIGTESSKDTMDLLLHLKKDRSKAKISNARVELVPQRFWSKLLVFCKIPDDLQWANINKAQLESLSIALSNMEMNVEGKSRNKEEFVECGGVSRKEINWKTMESKIQKGLYFGGEITDVDGITGGFNLQSAWTAGYIAGSSMVE
ncbi:MAG: NAD(P)/FAD-dependent oxidoreductase [Proteobacteria bacterium]|jgi:predicted Rossmann fold flavoprotein|nr:NAD(P)/FAD-dependent oxidoreductase [Pseudomonadota bacterium]